MRADGQHEVVTPDVVARLGGEVLVVLDLDGRLVAIEGSQRPEVAWMRAAVEQRSWRELVHPDDAAALEAGLAEVLRGGTLDPIAFRVRLPDGQQRWVRGRASGDPAQGRAFLLLRDATEERRRFEIEDRLARLGRVGTYEIDLEHGVTRWSGELRRIFGLGDRDEPLDVSETLACFLPPGQPKLVASVEQLFATRQPFELELALRPRVGPDRWVRCTGEALHHDGRTVMILGTVQDLTAAHRERLRLARIEQLAQLTDNGLLELDEQHRVRFANPRALALLGSRDPVSAEGRGFLELLPEGTDPAPWQDLFAGGEARTTRRRLAIGRDRWVQVAVRRGQPADGADGAPRDGLPAAPPEPTLLIALSDITELIEVERARDAFLASVSHELRSPLSVVVGSLGTLERGVAGPLPSPASVLLEMAGRSARRLQRLQEDLLDTQRILAGRFPLAVEEHDLVALVTEVLDELRPGAVRADRTLVLREAPEPLPVRGDGLRIQQVVMNLVTNALRYAPPGSTAEVALSSGDGVHRVVVRDHGPGVPPAFADRIFQRFAQADPDDPRSAGGTGLGLAISRELVERMGGRIDVDSQPGRTEFWFELPASDATGP